MLFKPLFIGYCKKVLGNCKVRSKKFNFRQYAIKEISKQLK